MRPKSPVLRYAFRAAKAKLESEKRKVTIGTLAEEMGANFKTAQRFLYRDRELATEIGVELEHVIHGLAQYVDAILSIPTSVRPTARRIGEVLGLDHSSVIRFVKAHPELCTLHPRFETWHGNGPTEHQAQKAVPVARRWRDLGLAVWHENGRFVGVCANRDEYLDYWSKGLLKHQMENKPKPEYLPTPEEVAHMT